MLMHSVAHRDTPICVTNETDLSVGAARSGSVPLAVPVPVTVSNLPCPFPFPFELSVHVSGPVSVPVSVCSGSAMTFCC